MFLDYFALGLLFFVGIVLFYGIIIIHDIPYEIAQHRNHPQQDAIHVAGWISLFTLHVIWPFLWIWATLYREDRGWGFMPAKKEEEDQKINELKGQIAEVRENLATSRADNERLGTLGEGLEKLARDTRAEAAVLAKKVDMLATEMAHLKQGGRK